MSDFYVKDGKLFPADHLTVNPMDGTDTVFGHTVSDLQENVFVGNGKIVGTLKYVSSGALATDWGAGNFMALKFDGDAFAHAKHIYVGMNPTVSFGLVDVIGDPDKSGVFKVTNKVQNFVAVIDYGTYSETLTFDLNGLTLATA